ncbi:MAG: MazF family transcriptional regulator [Hyphomicrobiales bacterium]|nr:MAG: MazF family transcriptional regulator [Hyphomicrobiales bacterium]
MKVQVAKWGNSTAVRLPKAVVEELGLRPGMTVDVSVEDGKLRLVPFPNDEADSSIGRPEPFPVTLEWMIEEARRLGGIENAPRDDIDWGPDVGSEVIYDDYNPRKRAS